MTVRIITDHDIATQVIQTLADHVGDFDVDGIVHAIVDGYGLVDIDIIPDEEYWMLVEAHAR